MAPFPPGWHALPPASAVALRRLRAQAPVRLPASYLGFLARSNGGGGAIGRNSVVLRPAEEVHLKNDNLGVYRTMPGALLIATDGGDDGYLLDGRRGEDDPPVLWARLGHLEFSAAR